MPSPPKAQCALQLKIQNFWNGKIFFPIYMMFWRPKIITHDGMELLWHSNECKRRTITLTFGGGDSETFFKNNIIKYTNCQFLVGHRK